MTRQEERATAPAAATWHAIDVVPALLLLGALLWQVRGILSPVLLFPLMCVVLWPRRGNTVVMRLLLTMGALTFLWFLWTTGAMFAPFILAFALAYFLAPAVAAVEGPRVPRGLAIVLVLLPFLLLLGLVLILLIPAAERQVMALAQQLPDLLRRMADWALRMRTRFLATSGGLLTDEQSSYLANLQPSDLVGMVNAQWSDVGRRIWSTLMGIGRGVSALIGVLAFLVVTPVVTFYLLKSWDRLTARMIELVPPAHRPGVTSFIGEYDLLLGRYIRGQILEGAIVGVLTGGTLALLGFPGALLVGLIAGIANLVPYIGLPISLVPGILFALVSPDPWSNLLKLGAVFAVVQFIDGSVTGPRIVGQSVGLNPVWVMIALVLFGSLLGFVGLLVAVPLAVLIKLLLERAVARYEGSKLYTNGTA